MRSFVIKFTLAGCILAQGLTTIQAGVVAGPVTNTLNGHIYFVVGKASWSQAQAEAQSLGGHLAAIRSADENQWILNHIITNFSSSGGPDLSALPLWIGLYDPAVNDGSQHAADFVWDSGETNAYRNWNSGEPSNSGNLEYYAAINWHFAAGFSSTRGTWNDAPLNGSTGYGGASDGPYYGIVEIGTGLPAMPNVPGAFYGPVTCPLNGHEYLILPPNNWSNAQAAAQALGGNLTTVRSAAENAWIVTNMLVDLTQYGGPNLSVLPVWLGLYDPSGGTETPAQHAADFTWISGETAAYRNWNFATGEPNNQNQQEFYTAINWHYAQGTSGDHSIWNDTPLNGTSIYGGNTDGPYYGLAEVNPAAGRPPNLVIVSVGLQGVQVLWPNFGAYTLQQNTHLNGSGWVTSGYTVNSINGTNRITVSPAAGNLLFRLSNP